jgi:hypothetical protein
MLAVTLSYGSKITELPLSALPEDENKKKYIEYIEIYYSRTRSHHVN